MNQPAEHRLLGVMFYDMVDSTGRQFRMDPEAFAALLRTYMKVGFDCAHRPGSRCASGCAVRAGYRRQDGARHRQDADCGKAGGGNGWVLVGDITAANAPRAGIEHATVIGSAANFAARLQPIAWPDGVVVGEGTILLLGDRFITEKADTADVKCRSRYWSSSPGFGARAQSA